MYAIHLRSKASGKLHVYDQRTYQRITINVIQRITCQPIFDMDTLSNEVTDDIILDIPLPTLCDGHVRIDKRGKQAQSLLMHVMHACTLPVSPSRSAGGGDE